VEAQDLARAQKKCSAERRLIVFIDECGLSQRPTRVRTWAPKGCTPVVQFHFNWKHVSAIAGLTRTNFLFRLCDGAVKSAQIVEFLKALRSQLRRRLLIVWDGAAQHKSRIVRDYLDSTKGAIQMALLPGYAPDLNPVEYLWAWLKRHALANFCPNSSLNSIDYCKPSIGKRGLEGAWGQATICFHKLGDTG
jgi:transposase